MHLTSCVLPAALFRRPGLRSVPVSMRCCLRGLRPGLRPLLRVVPVWLRPCGHHDGSLPHTCNLLALGGEKKQ